MKEEAESADRAVAKVLEAASKKQHRRKCNSYTFEQRAVIGNMPSRMELQLQQNIFLKHGT